MANKFANERDAIFAEEAFVVEVQGLLYEIMEQKGLSRADLARALNVSRARVTQIFSDECKNLTIRLLARAMHCMDETPAITCKLRLDAMRSEWEKATRQIARGVPNVVPIWHDETDENEWSANDNCWAALSPNYEAVA